MNKIATELDQRGVFTITLQDEAKRNALSQALTAELGAAIDRADADSDVRVVVLTNTSHVFCSGADLSEQAPSSPLAILRRIQQSTKPWVGRIAGHAVAGGTGLAAAVDIAVTNSNAKFGFTEVRLGLAPAVMSAICLPKMRPADATAAFLRGQRFDGTEAARLGLVYRAVEPDEIDAAVDEIVNDLLLGGPLALMATKDVLRRVPQMLPDDAFEWAVARSAELFGSAEAAEGMAAYVEKRSPQWAPPEG